MQQGPSPDRRSPTSPFANAKEEAAANIGLGFTAGFVEALGFIALFGLFTAQITGNVVLAGVDLAHDVHGIIVKLLAVPTFIVTVALVRWLVVAHRTRGRNWLRALLLLQTGLLLLFMLTGWLASPFTRADAPEAIVVGLLGVSAMAVQNARLHLLLPRFVPTTLMTGNMTRMVFDLLDSAHDTDDQVRSVARSRLQRTVPTFLAFTAGAFLGAYGYVIAGFAALSVPLIVLLAMAVGFQPTRSAERI